jgi:predicted SAM-dependent methyltransferase
MKLNIGCGKQYLPGYINVDLFENVIADRISPADSLDFVEDNSVDEISSFHLIEHLGLVKTYKTLSHWALKLKPGGKLCIETPDLEESIEAAVKGKSHGDQDWLFGVGDPGQGHGHVFYIKELVNILKSIGFRKVQVKPPLGFWKQKTFRMECKRGPSDLVARIMEKWCGFPLSQGVFRQLPLGSIKIPIKDKQLAEWAVYSPKLSIMALNVLINNGLKNKENYQEYLKVLQSLDEIKLPYMLFNKILSDHYETMNPEKQFRLLKKDIQPWILRSMKQGRLDTTWFEAWSGEIKNQELFDKYPDQLEIFCQHNINELSVYECALGIKEFSKSRYRSAIEHFENSVKFNFENTISWWNLARLHWIEQNKVAASRCFDTAFKLSKDPEIPKERSRKVPIKRPLEIAYASEI